MSIPHDYKFLITDEDDFKSYQDKTNNRPMRSLDCKIARLQDCKIAKQVLNEIHLTT